MRLAPVAMAYSNEVAPALARCAESSRTTHGAREAVDACRYLGALGSGYVVQSLEAALWAFNKAAGFREGCLLAVNLGDDADTTGAVFGQLAGACYGATGIPEEWLSTPAWRDRIEELALRLERFSRTASQNKGMQ